METKFKDLLDKDQKRILMVYSLYTDEEQLTYLQYSSACAVFFYLNQKQFFDYNSSELLVYDYLETRHYMWEAKKFMNDINVLRDFNFLIRARCRSSETRDVNAHQCSKVGKEYLKQLLEHDKPSNQVFSELKKQLSCNQGKIKTIILGDNMPYFECDNKKEFIHDFLNPASENNNERNQLGEIKSKPFFLASTKF